MGSGQLSMYVTVEEVRGISLSLIYRKKKLLLDSIPVRKLGKLEKEEILGT